MSVKRKTPENDDNSEEKEAKEPKYTIRNTTMDAFEDVRFFLNYLINYQKNVLEGTFDAWKSNNILGSDLLEEIKTNHEITFDSKSFIEKEDRNNYKILSIDIFLVFTRKIFKKHSVTTWCRLYDNVSYEEDTGYIKI